MYHKLFPSFFPFPKKAIKIFFQGLVLVVMSDVASYAMDEREDSESSFVASSSESEIDERGASESSPPFKRELSHQTSKKCTFTDWMCHIGRNTFNSKALEDQHRFKAEVAQYALQLAELVCKEINTLKSMEDLLNVEEALGQKDPEDEQRFKEEVAQYAPQLAGLIFKEINTLKTMEDLLNVEEAPGQEERAKITGYIRQIVKGKNPIKVNPSLAMNDKKNPYHHLVNSIAKVLYKIITGQLSLINGSFVSSKFFAYMSADPEFLELIISQEGPVEEGTILIRQQDIIEKLNDPLPLSFLNHNKEEISPPRETF
jgi:hypothetical protein